MSGSQLLKLAQTTEDPSNFVRQMSLALDMETALFMCCPRPMIWDIVAQDGTFVLDCGVRGEAHSNVIPRLSRIETVVGEQGSYPTGVGGGRFRHSQYQRTAKAVRLNFDVAGTPGVRTQGIPTSQAEKETSYPLRRGFPIAADEFADSATFRPDASGYTCLSVFQAAIA